LQIATRELSVAPNATAMSGALQRAVESTNPWLSVAGMDADGLAGVVVVFVDGLAAAIGTPTGKHSRPAAITRRVRDVRVYTPIPDHNRPDWASAHTEQLPNRWCIAR
jgi:hypothetical protein